MNSEHDLEIDGRLVWIELIECGGSIECWKHYMHDEPSELDDNEMEIGCVWIPLEMGIS